MKLLRIIIILIFFSSQCLKAQDKLNAIKTPTSPAASILGIQPTVVLSPKSYQALETALYSNFLSEGNTVIPNDFSLEFTPYWTKNHKLELVDYLYPKGIVEQLKRNSSFSIASTQNIVFEDSTKANGLGFGYRATFFFGGQNDRKKIESFKIELNKNQSVVTNIVSIATEMIVVDKIEDKDELFLKLKPEIEKVLKEKKINQELNDKYITQLKLAFVNFKSSEKIDISTVSKAIDETYNTVFVSDALYEEFKDYIKNRYGFYLDIAYGNFLNFPSNDFEYSIVARQSVWLTPTYHFKDNLDFLKLMGVFRYEWNNTTGYYEKYFPSSDKIYKNNVDYGIAVSAELNKFSIQFELVGREGSTEKNAGIDVDGNSLYRKENNSDLQYVGTLNYNLTDGIILSYSLGKKFQIIPNSNDSLVSLLSLNFGFGAPTKENLK